MALRARSVEAGHLEVSSRAWKSVMRQTPRLTRQRSQTRRARFDLANRCVWQLTPCQIAASRRSDSRLTNLQLTDSQERTRDPLSIGIAAPVSFQDSAAR